MLMPTCHARKSRDQQQLYGVKTVKILYLFFHAKDKLQFY